MEIRDLKLFRVCLTIIPLFISIHICKICRDKYSYNNTTFENIAVESFLNLHGDNNIDSSNSGLSNEAKIKNENKSSYRTKKLNYSS